MNPLYRSFHKRQAITYRNALKRGKIYFNLLLFFISFFSFDQGNRIMGMGHAVYKTIDPRARILQKIAEKMSQRSQDSRTDLYEITKKMAEVTQQEFSNRKGRQIYPNVDLFSASVYSTMGISSELFTPIFAISRAAGWIAHALEEKFPETPNVKPVLYRPSADYTGNYCGSLGCVYTPLEKREHKLDFQLS